MNRHGHDLILEANTHNSLCCLITGMSMTVLTSSSVAVLQRCRPFYGEQFGDNKILSVSRCK